MNQNRLNAIFALGLSGVFFRFTHGEHGLAFVFDFAVSSTFMVDAVFCLMRDWRNR